MYTSGIQPRRRSNFNKSLSFKHSPPEWDSLFVLSLFDLKAWKFSNFEEADASLSFNKECPILEEKLYFIAGIFAELPIAQKSSLFVVHALANVSSPHHQFEKR